nr:uncharacterized protein CTRU02_06025 [Colletotrichum truncatum]KAF6793153.1 hypothetical protein CTRU02_06025 [Colletotrichum truncatum]
MEKRTDFSRASYSCYDAPIRASSQRITEGIRYLRAVKGRPRAGPNQKGRVSCSYGAGIWWVNRASTTKTLASFGSIADGAQHLMNRCRFGASVGGITTHPTRWEVQVYRTSC